jgi:threonine aldolase
MRQAGILAAAGLHAVEHHRARLAEDHANARALAEALAGAPNVTVDLARVQTNIVMIDLPRGTADAACARAREHGILLGSAGARRIRAVAHLDVGRDACLRAAQVIAEAAAALA